MAQETSRRWVSQRTRLVVAFALGALVATGQAPLSWAWVAFAAIAVMIFLHAQRAGWRGVAWRGWAFGTGHFAVALAWIIEPFMVDVLRHGWMAPFALFFLSGGLALFWAAAFGIASAVGRTSVQRALWLVVTWTIAEWLRAHVLTGFPWAMPGHIWIEWPQMQAASLFGAHGLTAVTLFAASMPVLFGARRVALGCVAGAALMSVPAGYALWRVPALDAPDTGGTIVRLIQPNAPQHEKWHPDHALMFFERQLALSAAQPAPDAPRPDVVIWPETAVPWLLEHAEPAFLQMAAAAGKAQTVVGVQRRDGGIWYNSLVVLDPLGAVSALYDKHHLVPFGEYMPLASVFARYGLFGLAANDTGGYAAGPGPRTLEIAGAGRILPLICYEAIFPNDIARVERRADWMIQITNDAWFGQIAGPYQHLALARLRSVEQGLPLARAANTGISVVIDPYGRDVAQIGLGKAGVVDAHLPAALAPTPYARLGDLPVLAVLTLASVFLVVRRRVRAEVDPVGTAE